MEQEQLTLSGSGSGTRRRSLAADPEIQTAIETVLDGRTVPMRRDDVRRVLGERFGLQITDDRLRAAARYSSGRIIGSSGAHGVPGYILTRCAPAEIINGVLGEYRSRAKQLTERATEVTRVMLSAGRSVERDRRVS